MGSFYHIARIALSGGPAFALLLLCAPSVASDTQSGAMNTAAVVQNVGSDDSMEAATNSAMVAIMNLAALNIPGAFSNGYRAYGQYINSEKMDDLEIQNLRRQNKMMSAGGGGMVLNTAGLDQLGKPKGNSSSISGRPTTFSRLDPSFLHKGETAEVAAEFEKRTGMSRGQFLKHLGSATDSDLSYNDPDLLGKLEARYELFKRDVKNEEFKQNLARVEGMFPTAARQEVLGKLQNMYFESWKDQPVTAPMSALASAGSAAPAASPAPSVSQDGASSVPASAFTGENGVSSPERAPASPAVARNGNNRMFIGISEGDTSDTLNEFLGSPDEADSESIFAKVHKRYRLIAPTLLGRANVVSSR